MPVIFIAGSASKESKAVYTEALTNEMPDSIYLNINNIHTVFSQPETSAFTKKYTYEQRMLHPGHEAVMGLALDNLPFNKAIIFDGDFNYGLTANLVQEQHYCALRQAGIYAVYFYSSSNEPTFISENLEDLEKLSSGRVLMIDTDENININIKKIISFVPKNSIQEQKTESKGILVMTAGLGGTGKTTLLKCVYPKIINSLCLDKDSVAIPFLETVSEGMPSDYYNIHVKNQSYEAVVKFGEDNLKLNKIPILEGCFGDKLTGALVKNHLASCSNYTTTLIYFHCSGPTQLARIKKRNAQRDTEKLKDIREDRRVNIQKHLKDFSQISPSSSMLFLDTEIETDIYTNLDKIIDYLASSDLKSLKMQEAHIPYDEQKWEVTQEEAQGGLAEFLSLLDRTILNNTLQEESSKHHEKKETFLSKARNTIWAEKNKGIQNRESIKLPSGTIHLWPFGSDHQDSEKSGELLRPNSVFHP